MQKPLPRSTPPCSRGLQSGLVPDEQIESHVIGRKRQAYWREAIEYCEPKSRWPLTARRSSAVGYDRSRDEKSRPTTGEIWAIYAAPTHWNQGVGLVCGMPPVMAFRKKAAPT